MHVRSHATIARDCHTLYRSHPVLKNTFQNGRWMSLADGEASIVWLNTVAFLLLVVLFMTAPFPYGAVTPSGTFVLSASSFVIAAMAFASRPNAPRIRLALVPVAAMVLIALVGVIQLVPMDPSTLR